MSHLLNTCFMNHNMDGIVYSREFVWIQSQKKSEFPLDFKCFLVYISVLGIKKSKFKDIRQESLPWYV